MTGCPPQTFFLFSSFLNLSLIKINNKQTFSRSWIYFALDLSWWPWVALLFERKMVQKLIWAWHATSGGAKTAAEPNKWANNKCTNNTRKIFNGRWIDCTNNLIWLPRALILGQKNDSILLIWSNHATESEWQNWRQNQQGIEEWRWGNSFNIILIYHIWPWPWDLISHISALTVCFNGYGENVRTSKPCGHKTCTTNASPPGSAKHSN